MAEALVAVGTPGYPEETVTDGHYKNLGPRVGFAYSVTPSTVIRAGFGIFYAYQTYNSNPMAKNAPFNGSLLVANASGEAGFAAAAPISAGFPASRPDLFPSAGTVFNVFQRDFTNPSANEWNFNIQQQLGAEIDAVGRLCRPERCAHPDQPEHQLSNSRTRSGGEPPAVSESR